MGGFKKTNAGKAIEQAVDEAVCFLVSMLDEVPWTGSVILVKGSKVYINRGTREGTSLDSQLEACLEKQKNSVIECLKHSFIQWVDGEDVSIKGAIPAYDVASTQPERCHPVWLSLCYHKRPYTV